MSLSLIPPELILTVTDNLPTASLNCLLRTCQSLRALLAPVLTKRITTERRATSILKRGIRHHHLPTVHLALAHKAYWHATRKGRRESCYNALHAACVSHQLDIVAALLTHYGPSMVIESRCYNPLEAALMRNDIAMVTVLLEHGVPVDLLSRREEDETALVLAARCGRAAMTELLVKHGAPVQSEPECLLQAITSQHWDVVRVLLREGVPVPNYYEWAGRAPLTSRSPDQIEAWIQEGLACTKAKWDEKLQEAEMEVQRADADLETAESQRRGAERRRSDAESNRRAAEKQSEIYRMFIAGNLTAHWNW